MTNKEFCARLRKAKKLAVHLYPSPWCIYHGCNSAGLGLGKCSIFDSYEWVGMSSLWVGWNAKSKDDIAAVFDNSIRALGEEP